MSPDQSNDGFCLLLVGYPMSGTREIAERLEEQLVAGGEDVEHVTAQTLERWFNRSSVHEEWTSSALKPLMFCIDRLIQRGVCCLLTGSSLSSEQMNKLQQHLNEFQVVHVDTSLSFCRKRADQKGSSHSSTKLLKRFEQGEIALEEPPSPMAQLNYETRSLDECVTEIMEQLARKNLLDLEEGPSSNQEEEVKDRLKNLGYI